MLKQAGELVNGVWEVGERIGAGTFSQIFMGTHVKERVRCALKVDLPGA